MKIAYLSSSYVPSRRASSIQVMKMCSAFARAGHEVCLVTKRCRERMEPAVDDDFSFYGVEPRFEITKIARPARRGGGLGYAAGLYRFLRARRDRFSLVYCRELSGAWLSTRLALPTVLEVHEPMPGPISRRLLRSVLASSSCVRLVAISEALAEHLGSSYDVGNRCMVAHDGADPGEEPRSRAAGGRIRIGYAGHLYPGKGLEILLPLARQLDECDFVVLGGARDALEALRAGGLPKNLQLLGFVPPGEVAARYRDLDILVMPYQTRVAVAGGRSDAGRWMSPLKMFEYMAAGKPIVSSDLPVLREILRHGENAVLVPPDDPGAWARAIRSLSGDADRRRRLGATARDELLRGYTWDVRSRRVLAGLSV